MLFYRIFALLLCWNGLVLAHQVASVELEFRDIGAQWVLEGELDIAYLLPETRDVPGGPPLSREGVMKSPPAELARIRHESEKRLRELVRLTFAGKEIPWQIQFPDFASEPFALPVDAADVAYLTVLVIIDAQVGVGDLRAFWAGGQETELIIVTEEKDDYGIVSALPGESVLLLKQAAVAGGTAARQPVARSQGWVRSGFHHVLAADHVLFILGLFLLAPGWKSLLQQTLLFTVAHSLSLALATFRLVEVSGGWLDRVIALSIAWVGMENLFVRKLGWRRMALVFGFGLLHGLGFAGSLAEKLRGVSGPRLAVPLIGFNVGVELAQIVVLAVAFLVLWPVREFTPQIRLGGSALIAVAGLAWATQGLW